MEMDGDIQANPPRSTTFSFLRGEQSLSLQMLAATNKALMLWRNKYYNPAHDGRPVWFTSPEMPESGQEHIAVPPPIKAIIDDRISTIGEEIKMWEANFRAAVTGRYVSNMWDKLIGEQAPPPWCLQQVVRTSRPIRPTPMHSLKPKYYNVLDEKHVDILVKGFDNIVCDPDGTICFQRSIRNFLMKEESQLDPKMRFRIACMFCLEEQIMQMWPSVNQMTDIFDNSRLMQYWNNKLNNVPIIIPRANLLYPPLFHRPTVFLVVVANNRNWSAFDYLWDKETEPDKISASRVIIAAKDFYSMKRVLLNLSEELAQNLCSDIGDRIFCNFVTHPKYYEYAMVSWTYMKNHMSAELFARIAHQLWQWLFNPSESELTRVKQTSAILLELWTSVDDSLKSNVSGVRFFDTLDCTVRGVHHYDLTFMFEILVNTSDLFKKEIWLKNWRKLMIRAKPSDLERLMKVCLGSDDEVEKFKQSTATNIDQLNDYFNDCFNKGLFSELSDYLNFFEKNPRRLENMCREMMMSNLDRIASCDEDEATQCHLFIRNTFHDDEKADQFIKGLVSSPECLGWIYCKLDDCRFDAVANLSRRFPSNNKNFKEMKEEFLIYCHRNFARGQFSGFHEQRFVEFVSWCAVGAEKVSKLKKSLIIDDVFELILNNFIREASNRSQRGSIEQLRRVTFDDGSREASNRLQRGSTEQLRQLRVLASNRGLREASKRPRLDPIEQLLTPFDNFLRWYFGSSEAAKNYKFVKLTRFHEWEGVMNALQTADSECVDKFLKWGFENDQNEVRKLKSRLR
ncbi:uncharacterized protein LOC135844958 isoform X1 [Planococcus citri]|uniref:uncharacterized protein LOC135844958 isoform X1 n=1 Tax=Planococcus citri TaxID=170843 RepID=UPI0031F9512B